MLRSSHSVSAADLRPSYLAAGIAAACVFALYLVTLAPTSALWDASEYIAAAYVLGIPHPPGNPFFVLVGNVAAHLPLPGTTPAMRVNMLAALSSAVAAGMWFLVTERVLAGWLPRRWQRITGGALAALVGATAFTVWNQSVVNEKVYTVSLALFAIVSWLVVRWCDDPDAPLADRLLVLAAFLVGLGYANHPAGLLPVPALGIAVLARRPRTLLRGRLLLACGAALVLGLTPFATQPIRAAYHPAINEGEPTACTDGFAWRCTLSAETWQRFRANVDREQYGKPPLLERQAPLTAQVAMWWMYFEWQWLRDAYVEHPTLQTALAVAFLALGVLGGWAHWRRDRRSFWFFGPLVLTLSLGLVIYLNFRYGWSQAPALGGSVPREVRDRDYFFLWSFSSWSVWVALGLVTCWRALARRLAHGGDLTRRRPWLLAAPLLLVALVPLLGNRTQAPRWRETLAPDFAHDLLNSVEPYGILITAGDNDTFPLWYAQEVEGVRRDVTVAVTSLLNTDWYARGLLRRPVYEYDADSGPAIYRDTRWPRPTRPVLALSIPEADAIPPYVQLSEPQLFREGLVEALVDPRNLRYGALERADLLVLRMIRDNAGTRAVHFSSTMGDYPDRLGLGPWLVTQGLARRLAGDSLPPSRDMIEIPGQGVMDVARTRALWDDVFRGPEAIVHRGEWVDRASSGIALNYVIGGATLGIALGLRGDTVAARTAIERARRVADASRTSDLVRLDALLPPPALPSDAPPRGEVPVRQPPTDAP